MSQISHTLNHSSSQHLIFALLITVLVSQEANMMLQLGQRLGFLKSMPHCWKNKNGSGVILLILCGNGVKHHTKRKFYDIYFIHRLITIIRPEKDEDNNNTFNYYVSRVRVHSEHCVGFLKGRWQSLRGLRVRINQSNHLQYASLWITTCVLLHAFAMEHEGGIDFSTDQFYRKGQELMRRERVERERGVIERDVYSAEEGEAAHDIELIEGRLKWEELKKALFSHLYGEN